MSEFEHDPHSHLKALENKEHVDEPSHDVGWAIARLRAGATVARAGWNGKGMWLYLAPGFAPGGEFTIHSQGFKTKRFLPYVAMRTVDGSCVPWLCSQTDLLATDWEEVHRG